MADSFDLSAIIAGCKKGDADCFSQIVDLYSKRCYGYFFRLCGKKDLSEDLLSELFVKLVERIKSYRGGSFDSWIFRIATNIFHDYLRSKQRQQKLLETKAKQLEPEPTGPMLSDISEDKIDKLQIRLGWLDDDMRELIMLRFYSELSFKEIAEVRGEPIGTTLSKLHRGLKKLRELME